jgi:hypothetical protein
MSQSWDSRRWRQLGSSHVQGQLRCCIEVEAVVVILQVIIIIKCVSVEVKHNKYSLHPWRCEVICRVTISSELCVGLLRSLSSLGFQPKFSMDICFSHASYICQPTSSLLKHSKNSKTSCLLQFSPPSCYFFPLRSKYSQHFVLKHCLSVFFPLREQPNFTHMHTHIATHVYLHIFLSSRFFYTKYFSPKFC